MLAPIWQKYRGLPPVLWKLLFTQFLMNATHFMVIPLFAIHMLERLQYGAVELGTVLTVHLVATRLLPFMTGLLADRFGARLLMIGGLLLRGLALIGFAFPTHWVALSLIVFLIGLGTALYESAIYGIFGRQSPERVADIFILNNLMLNVGVVIGPLVGTLLLTIVDSSAPFIVSGVLFLVLGYWAMRIRDLKLQGWTPTPIAAGLRRVINHRVFLIFFLASMPWWFLFTQLYVSFPIHMERIAGQFGVAQIFLVNGVVGLVFMLGSVLLFERLRPKRILVLAYLAAALLFLAAPISQTAAWFLLFVALYTMVETVMLPTLETITAELSEEGSQSAFFGAASLAWAIAGTLGNYIGSWLVLEFPPTIVWSVYGGIGFLGIGASLWFTSVAARRTTQRATA